jgi:hypothetical protein
MQLLGYLGKGIFQDENSPLFTSEIRVMHEGYFGEGKRRIPSSYLAPKRHYWCRYQDEKELCLMRYEQKGEFYSISHDVLWPSSSVKVIFEDYEH